MVFLLTIAFFFTRILHLLFCFPEPFTEELLRGTIAKELIEGLKIPFFEYAADPYSGGSLVYGALTVPWFLLLGKNVFALRLTGILFQLGAFLCWYCLMRRFFGKRAALFTALLYLFSPPWLTLYSMYAMGVHAESLFFTALGLWFLFRILYDRRHPLRDAACLGLVAGFGSYFSYQHAVAVVCYLLFWFYEDREVLKRNELPLFCVFFLIGFSPWFVYNSLYPLQGLERVQRAFAYPGWEKLFILPFRFLKLATVKILGMLSFNYRGGARYHPHITFLNLLYYAAILFSYAILCRLERKNRKAHFFFLFPPLFLLIASLSRLDVSTYESRYFVPLFPFFFAVIALGLVRLGELSKRLQKVSVAALVFLLAMGFKGELNLLSPKEFKVSLKHQGYSYQQLAWALELRYPQDLGRLSTLAKKAERGLTLSERWAFYFGLTALDFRVKKWENLDRYLPWIKGFDKAYQPFYFEEIGRVWGDSGALSEPIREVEEFLPKEDQPYLIVGFFRALYGCRMKPHRVLDYGLKLMEDLTSQNQKAVVYAMGKLSWRRSLDASLIDKIKRRRQIERRFPKKLLPLYYRGVGAHLASLEEWPEATMRHVEQLDETRREALFWGAGFEMPLLFEDPYEYERMARAIPPRYRNAFEQGLSDRFAWGGRNWWIEDKSKINLSSQAR